MTEAFPSKAQVDKAGQLLRQWVQAEGSAEWLDSEEGEGALEVFARHRASFFPALHHVAGSVSGCVATIAPGREVSFRHKRAVRIIEKLTRLTTMRLSQMEDIGGCRAVLASREEVRRVLDALRTMWPDLHVDDYVSHPKSTGYRAVHVVVVQWDRMIEIQLRTERQNRWADVVEQTGDRLGIALKDGGGPAELLEYFNVAADKLAAEEEGEDVEHLEQALAALREKVRGYFRE